MRQANEVQALILSKKETIPIYLVELGDGSEFLSTNGDRVVGGSTYIGGDLNLSAVNDWSTANISLAPTPERIAWMLSGAWRGIGCRISLFPGAHFTTYSLDYYSEDYLFQGDCFSDPILLMPGKLSGGRVSGDGRVEFNVVHVSRTARWAPPFRIGPPWCNHLPRAGEVITWAGERFIVEAK